MRSLIILILMVVVIGCQKPDVVTPRAPANEVGNGGTGILKNGHVYLLDFAEIGIETSFDIPLSTSLINSPRFQALRARLETNFPFNAFPLDTLTSQVLEIEQVDPLMAHTLLLAMGLHSWSFTKNDLIPLSVTSKLKGEFVPIANRSGRSITINQPNWDKMNAANQTGLILHEVTYALLKPLPAGRAFSQLRARELTGTVFRRVLRRDSENSGFLPQDISPGELPYLLNKKDAHWITSSFFVPRNLENEKGVSLENDAVGYVGSVFLELNTGRLGRSEERFVFDEKISEKGDYHVNRACDLWSGTFPGKMSFDVVFGNYDGSAQEVYELRFQDYQDEYGINTFLAHTKTNKTKRIPIHFFNPKFKLSDFFYDMFMMSTKIAIEESRIFPSREEDGSPQKIEEQIRKQKEYCVSNLTQLILDTFESVFPMRP